MKLFLVLPHFGYPIYIYRNCKLKTLLFSYFDYAPTSLEYLENDHPEALLDSSAFSMMTNPKKLQPIESYTNNYAEFINEHKIDKFFELDLDSIIGYDKVKKIRSDLEDKTGKQVIPVWHRSRGKNDFIRMCKKYSQVAIGGFVVKTISKTEYNFMKWFTKTAHCCDAKIHGLGLNPEHGQRLGFDSVDVSSWTAPLRFGGAYYKFDGERMAKITCGRRLVNHLELVEHQLNEWCKYQNYLEKLA